MSDIFPTSVRLPMRIRKLLRQEAKKNGRAFTRHIEWILTQHLVAQGIEIDVPSKKKKSEPSNEHS